MPTLHFIEKFLMRTEFAAFLLLALLVFLGFARPYWLLFLAVLFVLVLVHEWGHFIVAKKTGMRVDEFGIGFPPKACGYKWGETEYTLNWLPIGGFVRIHGENGEEPFSPVPDEVGDDRSEPLSGEAGRGGTKSVQLQNSDRARTFGARPKWAQALVLVAGVVMNVIFAWILMSVALMIGVPTVAEETVASDDATLQIMGVLPDSPAADAHLPVGATIVSLQTPGQELVSPTPTSFREFIAHHHSAPITIAYGDTHDLQTVTVAPQIGLAADDIERPVIGVSLAYTEIKQETFLMAWYEGAVATGDALIAITRGLGNLLVGTVMGTADFSQVAGPVGIAGLVGDAAEFGLTSLMLFTAMISLNLAVINLLPVPALDGGRLLFVAAEAVTGKEIPAVWMMRVNLIGFTLLMLLMILVTYGDISKIL